MAVSVRMWKFSQSGKQRANVRAHNFLRVLEDRAQLRNAADPRTRQARREDTDVQIVGVNVDAVH